MPGATPPSLVKLMAETLIVNRSIASKQGIGSVGKGAAGQDRDRRGGIGSNQTVVGKPAGVGVDSQSAICGDPLSIKSLGFPRIFGFLVTVHGNSEKNEQSESARRGRRR